MTRGLEPQRRRFVVVLSLLFWTAAFAIAFTQWPLYSENQNTKFLHGLATAGVGTLRQDWLANTIDPLPAFTLVVDLTARLLHPNLFYLWQALLLGIYLYSLLGIADIVFDLKATRAGQAAFLVVVIALHGGLIWPFSVPFLGASLSWLLQAGVANQYLFNPVFQPATFGVLLILSIYLFLRGFPLWATAVAALSALFHSTYLPAAGVLTLAYMLMTWREERSVLRAAAIGLLGSAIVAPVFLYNAMALGPTSPESWARAQAIIVNDRIPHHSLPAVWLDRTVAIKLAIVALALIVVRRSRLFFVMVLAAIVAVTLTWVEMRGDSDLIAFVAPWRMSVFLVPLSTSMLIAWAIAGLCDRFASAVKRFETPILIVAMLLLFFVVGKGALAMRESFAVRRAEENSAMVAYARASGGPSATYLTPTYMADFRLLTGVPVVVTWKSHPYKDVEVIAWKERIDAVNSFYDAPSCEAADAMAAGYGVTHILFEGDLYLTDCPDLTLVHRDDRFAILALTEAP